MARPYTLTPAAIEARKRSGQTRSITNKRACPINGKRLWKRLAKNNIGDYADVSGGPQSCWTWKGYKNKRGYGSAQLNGRRYGAHVAVYMIAVGPVPEGLELDHLCRNPSCVNPAHLEPVTHRVNTLRGEAPTAKHARKTHCKNGHEFTPENTGPHKSNGRIVGRYCKICNHLQSTAYQKRKREKNAAN